MRIIKVADFATTGQGAERLLLSRVKKISNDTRFDNFIICPESEEAQRISGDDVRVVTMKIARTLGIVNVCIELVNLYRVLAEEKPDILHTHNSKAGALGRIVCFLINLFRKKRIYVIHQVHGYHFTKLKGVSRAFFFRIEKLLSYATDALLFQNRYEFDLSKKFSSKKTSLFLIGNGINFEQFPVMKKTETDSNIKNIVCIARIEPVKNHEMILDTAVLLKEKYSYNSFKIILIGEGDIERLSKIAAHKGLSEQIVFTGKVGRKEITEYLSMADISVLASKKEGMPRSLMESMYYSVPCVGTDVVGTNEIIVDGFNGYLVALDNVEDFAGKIYHLLTDNDLRRKLGKNARMHCLENFNEDIVIGKIMNIYLNACGE